MKIKIIKCSVDTFWYKDHIGKFLDSCELSGTGKEYCFSMPTGWYYVGIEDAVVQFTREEYVKHLAGIQHTTPEAIESKYDIVQCGPDCDFNNCHGWRIDDTIQD